jgi:hypothetical protein
MSSNGHESYEQLELEGSTSSADPIYVPEKSTGDKIIQTAQRFLPGIDVTFDEENDEIVLRENAVE